MPQVIRLKRGTKSTLPTTGMAIGEPHWTTDRGTLHVADSATTSLPLVPAIDDLVTLATVDGANDFLLIHDASQATGQKEKKITFSAFKTALNIPEASTDELVAVVSGGTAGYIWGTDGTDGILRAGAALSYAKDAGNAFVTLNVADAGITNAKLAAAALSLSGDFTGNGVTTPLALAADSVGTTELVNLNVTEGKLAAGAVTETKIGAGAVTNAKLAASALNLGAVFSGNGVTTSLTIAAGGVTNAMLSATALDVNATTFTGNGVTTELDIAVIDGGTF